MIIGQGWVRANAEAIERLRPAAVAMMTATRAEAGCLDYAFAVDLADPGLLWITERWVDDAALAAHFATPHTAAFGAALGGIEIIAASVKAYPAEEGRTLIER